MPIGGGKVELALAVAADYANRSSEGKLNIMGIFQEVNPIGFPAALQQMFLVIAWEAGPAEFNSQKDLRIAFMDQDNNEKVSLDVQLQVPEPTRPGARAYFNQIIGMGGLPLERSGEHVFFILVGGEEKGRVALYVNEPPEGGTAE